MCTPTPATCFSITLSPCIHRRGRALQTIPVQEKRDSYMNWGNIHYLLNFWQTEIYQRFEKKITRGKRYTTKIMLITFLLFICKNSCHVNEFRHLLVLKMVNIFFIGLIFLLWLWCVISFMILCIHVFPFICGLWIKHSFLI